MKNPDDLLIDLQRALAYAPNINDLDVRLRWLRIMRDKAAAALVIDPMTVEQREAISAVLRTIVTTINETALLLPLPPEALEIPHAPRHP